MKKTLILLSLLTVIALALTGCAQQTPPAANVETKVEEAAKAAETQVEEAAKAAETAVENAADTAVKTAEDARDAAAAAVASIQKTADQVTSSLELTVEELAKYNGKNGERAYVAVDGVIYDVTDSAAWKEGAHNGFEAGQDLTEAIKTKSPHGVAKLENVVPVGTLKAE